MKVLLLIDLQRDFFPKGSLGVEGADEIIPVVNREITSGKYDLVVASADWHPENHSSFALWPAHCIEGSRGASFHPGLISGAIDHVIRKGTDIEIDSYSAFFDNERKRETELRTILETAAKERGESVGDVEVTVCGLVLEYCVGFSALDSQSLGFKTKILLEGCRALNVQPGDDLKKLRELALAGVELVEPSRLQQIERAAAHRYELLI